MRCREAKQLLTEIEQKNDGMPMPIELARHLKGCPDCARLATAGRIVTRGFKDLAETKLPETTSLAAIRSRISERSGRHRQEEPTFMFALWKKLMSHPRMSLGFASGLLVLILMATIPVSCSRTVGYSVDGTDADQTQAAAIDSQKDLKLTLKSLEDGRVVDLTLRAEKIQEALDAIGHNNAHVVVDEQSGEQSIHIDGLKTHEEAREAALILQRIAGFEGEVSIAEQKARVKSSLLNHIAHKVLELNVETDGKSDAQIEDEIRAQLDLQGVDMDVMYRATDDGGHMIFIGDSTVNGDGSLQFGDNQVIEWIASDSSGGLKNIQLNGDGSMTTEEMEKAMLNQLIEQGIDPANVKVKRIESKSDDSN